MVARIYLVFIVLAILVSCRSNQRLDEFRNGDIIFQTSRSDQSKAIQIATSSKYSHVGIVYKQEDKIFVYEAVQQVKLTPLTDWIKRGEESHYVLKRIKKADELLTDTVIARMKKVGEKYAGKNYDLYFEWTNSRIYCSELVWKIYKEALGIELGELGKLGDFNLDDSYVKTKLKERYGDDIPKEELVISPATMFESEHLITVYSN